MERYVPVAKTRPKQPRVWLLFLKAGYKTAVLGTTILTNEEKHFGPTDRDNRTGQREPPSKLVPNFPVGPNRHGPLHLKFPEFWVEWKAAYYFPLKLFFGLLKQTVPNPFPLRPPPNVLVDHVLCDSVLYFNEAFVMPGRLPFGHFHQDLQNCL